MLIQVSGEKGRGWLWGVWKSGAGGKRLPSGQRQFPPKKEAYSPTRYRAAALMISTAPSMPMRLLTHRSYSRLSPQRPVEK